MAAAFLTALALVGVVGQTSSVAAKGQLRKLREGAGSFRSLHDGGTYNPKSAWMMVDSRRRVLPDIDVEEHFASVESHILSDIHNYHVGEFQRRRLEEEKWEDEWEDQLGLEDRVAWPRRRVGHFYEEDEQEEDYLEDQYLSDEYPFHKEEEEEEYPEYPGYRWNFERGRYRESPRGQHDYSSVADFSKLDYPSAASSKLDYPNFPDYDPYYEPLVSVSTVEPILTDEAADRQFTTAGLGNPPGHSVLGITSHSAVGLLGLLLFINILRDVIQQITGGRKKRDVRAEEEVESNARIANMLFRMEKKFKQMQ